MGSLYEDGMGEAGLRAVREFDSVISDDLGTPRALALLSAVLASKELSPIEALRVVGSFDLVLGLKLLSLDPRSLAIRPVSATLSDDEANARVQKRERARAQRDFTPAHAAPAQLHNPPLALQDY